MSTAMKDEEGSRTQLLEELYALRQRVAALEAAAHERQQIEAELQTAKEYAETLIKSSLDMIISVDTQRKITEFNHAAERAFGYSKAEVIGRLVDLLYAQPAEGIQLHLLALNTGGVTQEITNKRKNGELFTAYLAASAMRDAQGQVVGVMGISRDVTEHQQAQEALRESEGRYRNLFENANDAIATFTLDGVITSVNRGAERMLGWSREELIGQFVSKVSTPASVALAEERTRRFLAGEKLPTSTFEAELLCKDGSVVPTEARTRAIRDREGKPVGFQGIYRDISAKTALEHQRADFLAMLTHDIKTPLSAILGYIDLLSEESADRRSAAEDQFLQRLRDNALTMNSLIANYLDFAKAEAGKLVLHKTRQPVSEILRRVRAQYGAMARRHHLTFTLDLAPELPSTIGDPLALERIFANLVHNALKFTPETGRVTISARHRAGAESTVVVEVRDSGPGIAPEEISLLFERYHRVSTVVRQHEGTGLGLFIVKTLVEAHGGRVEVESSLGSGTCFRVLLPAAS